MGRNGTDTPETGLAVGDRVGRLAEQGELAFILQVAPNLWRQAIAPRGAGAFVSRTRSRGPRILPATLHAERLGRGRFDRSQPPKPIPYARPIHRLPFATKRELKRALQDKPE